MRQWIFLPLLFACGGCAHAPNQNLDSTCQSVDEGAGPVGTTKIAVEVVAQGLEVPWGIGFLEPNRILVTERPGKIRLIENGTLISTPLATVSAASKGESGLLGVAVDPKFKDNRRIYLYVTSEGAAGLTNRVERWTVSPDFRKAEKDKVIIDAIPGAQFHDGGRLRFGPDGYLYVGTGDAREPSRSQNVDDLAGKILRVDTEGSPAPDNPWPKKRAFISGIRNTQGFDWLNSKTLLVTDHGPSGELMGRRGHDEINVGHAGDNLGWPSIWGCEAQTKKVTPRLTWAQAVPPGGAAIYTGTQVPEWTGSVLVGVLGARHLHRVVLSKDFTRVETHEVYLQDAWGRLRDVVMGPDGNVYLTTSNCDGRGDCGEKKDYVLRVVPGSSS